MDLLLSGHDHDMKVEFGAGTAFVESGAQAEFVTIVEVAMDMAEGRGGPRFVWEPSVRIVNTVSVTPDPQTSGFGRCISRGAGAGARRGDRLDFAVELDSRRSVVRSRESGIANLIADAMRAATGADVALTNGGGIRADKVYPPGTTLLRRDIQSELPFGNRTILIEVTGADLLAALENGVSGLEAGAGRFPHVSGMAFRFHASKLPGSRVDGVTVGGEPLDPSRTYRLATNDFLGRGGDGYDMFAGAPRLIDAASGKLMADAGHRGHCRRRRDRAANRKAASCGSTDTPGREPPRGQILSRLRPAGTGSPSRRPCENEPTSAGEAAISVTFADEIRPRANCHSFEPTLTPLTRILRSPILPQ